MSFGMTLCLIATVLFIGTVVVAATAKSQLFSFDNGVSHFKKTASESATLVLESYDVRSDDENHNNTPDEINEENEELYQEEDELDENSSGIMYETIQEEEKPKGRTYETFADKSGVDMLENFQKEDIKIHSCVEEIDGKKKYGIRSGNDFSVCLSKDVYNSNSIASVCIASYQAVKLSEGVDKPVLFKVISLINFVPKIICQFIWFITSAIILGLFPVPDVASCIIGAVAIVCVTLALLDSLYYFELNKITLNKMIQLEILDEAEIDLGTKMLNLIAINESSRFLGTLRWFANKIMGYNV